MDKTKSAVRTPTYYLYYEYWPLASDIDGAKTKPSVPLMGQQRVRKSDWDQPQIGESYTVLYSPQDPRSSVLYRYLYRYGDYAVAN